MNDEQIENLTVHMPTLGRVTVDGVTTAYAKIGDGARTLVIVPGLSLTPVTPQAVAIAGQYALFGADYTVWVFDPRDEVPEGYTLEAFADDLAHAMGALGVGRACVFGASMGGMVSQYLAIRHPETVRALALGSTTCTHTQLSAGNARRWVRLATAAADGDAAAAAELGQALMEHIYSPETIAKYGSFIAAGNASATPEAYAKVARLADAVSRVDCAAALAGVTVPALVIGAEGDRMVSPDGSREIAAALPNATLVMYGPEFAHAVYDEAPDYAARLFAFFEGAYV